MARYSQTDSGERIQHFDTLEELEAHNKLSPKEGSYLGCFLLFVSSAVFTYFMFYKLGFPNAAKWMKATAILAIATPLGIVGYKYGELILGLIYLAIFALLAIWGASFVWSLL